jgi:hypothetical protein
MTSWPGSWSNDCSQSGVYHTDMQLYQPVPDFSKKIDDNYR